MKIAICGITGAVGSEILQCLDQLNVKVDTLTCFASNKSKSKEIETPFGKKIIEEFDLPYCKGYDYVFLCISGNFSKMYGKQLSVQNKCVIDSSSHFRYDEDIPLIIPEINGHLAQGASLIANPNCTTAILSVALYPIYKTYGLKKVIVSTYQATSGGGRAAMKELEEETRNYLDDKPMNNTLFAHPIPFNLIPAIDVFMDNGYTKEEMKVVWETKKIFNDNDIKISTTAVRIPIFRAHSESVTVQTKKPIDIKEIKLILDKAPGIQLVDNPDNDVYPMPITSNNKYDVEVGRIRANLVFDEFGLDFFISGDQLLKGAALNAVQIAKLTM